MLKTKLQRLEKKVKTLDLGRESFPSAIVIRTLGCCHPRPERITVSDNGAVPIYRLCELGGGDCETCRFYDPERLRRDREKRRKTA